MNEQHMLEVITKLEPDFDPVEELIIEHISLHYTGLQPRQARWYLDELGRLCSLSTQYITEARMKALDREAYRRAKGSQ